MIAEFQKNHIEISKTSHTVFDNIFLASQASSPLYEGVLANHLPMTLIAMQRLGASDAQMLRFYNHYQEKLEARRPSDLDTQLLHQIKQQGIERVTLEVLIEQAQGICASAFHALIRLGYAIMIKDPIEVAIALTYLRNESQPLGIFTTQKKESKKDSTDLLSIMNDIIKHPALLNQTISAPNIIVRMQKVSEITEFSHIVSSCALLTTHLKEITQFTLALYNASQDFTALHGVTSCHALRIIMVFLQSNVHMNHTAYQNQLNQIQTVLLRYYVLSLAAAYISIGTPRFDMDSVLSTEYPSSPKPLTLDWKKIIEQAFNEGDDHDIKFLFTCIDQYEYTHIHAFYTSAKKHFNL